MNRVVPVEVAERLAVAECHSVRDALPLELPLASVVTTVLMNWFVLLAHSTLTAVYAPNVDDTSFVTNCAL